MAIRPADLPGPLMPLGGVTDTNRSMERDARERGSYARQQHQGGSAQPEPDQQEQETEEKHLLDECA